ncbi:MAG: 2-isopropylmalate synthase [Armatimonadota bacterium]|nr:MAG: 2-isopropylmalate synthase [Armatimonadota bacterium]
MPRARARRIAIFDTTLRDGEQSPGASLNVQQKLEIARQLERLRVDVIEAGFPASSPGDFDAVKTISESLKETVVCGLTRARQDDIDVAHRALRKAAHPRIHTGLGVSDIHLQYKLKRTREQALEMGVGAVRHARKRVPEVEYFLEDAGRADPEYLYRVVEQVIKAGATVINVPDTTGYTYPEEFGALIGGIRDNVPNIDKAVISVHCHNDLGMATANALAGVHNGAGQVECTINGIGERAGNTALEEVVMALATRRKLFNVTTRIRTKEIYKASRLVSDLTGIPVQPNKAIVGTNAFAHSSGIHQDGVLKERTTYEIIDPRSVGVPESRIVLTARSGRHGLRHRLSQLGYEVSGDQFDEVYRRFLEVADKKKEVYEEDLESLVADELYKVPEIYHLDYLHVVGGSGTVPSATVRLIRDDEALTAAELGVGPVDAVYKAIDSLVKEQHRLVDFSVKSVTSGTDALGEVYVRVADSKDRMFSGRGSSTDIIDASAKAYVQALNRLAGRQMESAGAKEIEERV